MQSFPRLHGYIIPQNNGQFKSSVKNKYMYMGHGITNILIKYIGTPPPQKYKNGRCAYYTVCSTPGKESQAFYNGVVLFILFVVQIFYSPKRTYLYRGTFSLFCTSGFCYLIYPYLTPLPLTFFQLRPKRAFSKNTPPRHFLFWVPACTLYIFSVTVRPLPFTWCL